MVGRKKYSTVAIYNPTLELARIRLAAKQLPSCFTVFFFILPVVDQTYANDRALSNKRCLIWVNCVI